MATSQAAYAIEKAIGHDDSAITQQDVAQPSVEKGTGDPRETMKALTWQGKGSVKVGSYISHVVYLTF
jgi:hypothetical protein